MNNKGKHEIGTYRIVLKGHIQKCWSDWFEGVHVHWVSDGDDRRTELECPAMDQAALHGMLARIRDLNLILLKVERSESDERSSS